MVTSASQERNPLGRMGRLSFGLTDGKAIPSARNGRMTPEEANPLALLLRRVGQTGRRAAGVGCRWVRAVRGER